MKNTKRSMIITTVLMVVVLVVAISTSTFAWYTASTTGSATTAVVTSASASSANISVGWEAGTTDTTVVFNNDGIVIAPMVPQATPTLNATAIEFKTANIGTDKKFTGTDTATPWKVQNPFIDKPDGDVDIEAKTLDKFYVVNHNVNSGTTVTVTATVGGDLASMLCIAVYVNDKLQGILTNMTAYNIGPVADGTDYTTLNTSSDLRYAPNVGFTFDLGAKGSGSNEATISINAWLDGRALESSNAGKSATFDLSFKAA